MSRRIVVGGLLIVAAVWLAVGAAGVRSLSSSLGAAHGAAAVIVLVLEIAAAVIIVCALAAAAAVLLVVKNRLEIRERRHYELYKLDLSMHDEAKPRDLHDMVEGLVNAARKWQLERFAGGQPFFALEWHYGPAPSGGMEWFGALRCEPAIVATLASVINSAYPDVRVGWTPGCRDPQPMRGRMREPLCVLRYRKERSFIYPITADEERDTDSSPLVEAIAQMQVATGVSSVVRLQLTPAPQRLEAWARARYHAHEGRLARSETPLAERPSGLRSVLHVSEMRTASAAQSSAMVYAEVQIATDSAENANRIAAPLTSHRGENRLQRRRMILRRGLYRRRFPRAYPPLLPSTGWGRHPNLFSVTELAHMLAVPSARLKTVPVRRNSVPRLPAPPDVPHTGRYRMPSPDDDAGADGGGGVEVVDDVEIVS